jgi:hypothetical protein
VGGKGAQKNPEIAPEGMVTVRILPAKFLAPGPIQGAASHPGVERVYPDPPAVSSPVRPACSLCLLALSLSRHTPELVNPINPVPNPDNEFPGRLFAPPDFSLVKFRIF